MIREIAGDSSLESWCGFAKAMLEPADPDPSQRGILVAERKRTIRGLVTYETMTDLSRGRVLLLRNAVVMDLALRETIAHALHRRIIAVAEDTECEGLFIEVTPSMAWIGEIWGRDTGPACLPVTIFSAQAPLATDARTNIVSVTAV